MAQKRGINKAPAKSEAAAINFDTGDILRLTLLQWANHGTPKGWAFDVYVLVARTQGFSCTETDVKRELQYLVDKNYMVEIPSVVLPSYKSYRIHAQGRDYLASRGLPN